MISNFYISFYNISCITAFILVLAETLINKNFFDNILPDKKFRKIFLFTVLFLTFCPIVNTIISAINFFVLSNYFIEKIFKQKHKR